jgi:predicted PurR-regulated permease PerM
VLSLIAGSLRVASLVICLIVVASFAIFVLNQTSSASTHQQQELNGEGAATTTTPGTPGSPKPSSPHKSTLHRAIDDASNELTSPFSGITSGSSSQWVKRSVNLVLTLIVYGFALGFLARVIRVRV